MFKLIAKDDLLKRLKRKNIENIYAEYNNTFIKFNINTLEGEDVFFKTENLETFIDYKGAFISNKNYQNFKDIIVIDEDDEQINLLLNVSVKTDIRKTLEIKQEKIMTINLEDENIMLSKDSLTLIPYKIIKDYINKNEILETVDKILSYINKDWNKNNLYISKELIHWINTDTIDENLYKYLGFIYLRSYYENLNSLDKIVKELNFKEEEFNFFNELFLYAYINDKNVVVIKETIDFFKELSDEKKQKYINGYKKGFFTFETFWKRADESYLLTSLLQTDAFKFLEEMDVILDLGFDFDSFQENYGFTKNFNIEQVMDIKKKYKTDYKTAFNVIKIKDINKFYTRMFSKNKHLIDLIYIDPISFFKLGNSSRDGSLLYKEALIDVIYNDEYKEINKISTLEVLTANGYTTDEEVCNKIYDTIKDENISIKQFKSIVAAVDALRNEYDEPHNEPYLHFIYISLKKIVEYHKNTKNEFLYDSFNELILEYLFYDEYIIKTDRTTNKNQKVLTLNKQSFRQYIAL